MASNREKRRTAEDQVASVSRQSGDARDEEIRVRAYEIYIERGALPGDGVEDCLRAERELKQIRRFTQNHPASSGQTWSCAERFGSAQLNGSHSPARPSDTVGRKLWPRVLPTTMKVRT